MYDGLCEGINTSSINVKVKADLRVFNRHDLVTSNSSPRGEVGRLGGLGGPRPIRQVLTRPPNPPIAGLQNPPTHCHPHRHFQTYPDQSLQVWTWRVMFQRCRTLLHHHLIGCVHLRSVRGTFLQTKQGKSRLRRELQLAKHCSMHPGCYKRQLGSEICQQIQFRPAELHQLGAH